MYKLTINLETDGDFYISNPGRFVCDESSCYGESFFFQKKFFDFELNEMRSFLSDLFSDIRFFCHTYSLTSTFLNLFTKVDGFIETAIQKNKGIEPVFETVSGNYSGTYIRIETLEEKSPENVMVGIPNSSISNYSYAIPYVEEEWLVKGHNVYGVFKNTGEIVYPENLMHAMIRRCIIIKNLSIEGISPDFVKVGRYFNLGSDVSFVCISKEGNGALFLEREPVENNPENRKIQILSKEYEVK